MKRFDKTKTIEDNYYPIYANNDFTNVNIDCSVNSMKNLHGFYSCNNISSGRIAKLQGGYYFLTDDMKWSFIGDSLSRITFRVILELFKTIKYENNNCIKK